MYVCKHSRARGEGGNREGRRSPQLSWPVSQMRVRAFRSPGPKSWAARHAAARTGPRRTGTQQARCIGGGGLWAEEYMRRSEFGGRRL